MAAEVFARLTIYLSQLGVSLLLSYLLWTLSRQYQKGYIRAWFVALTAFLLYQLTVLLQWSLGPNPLLQTVVQFIVIVCSYGFAAFLMRGMVLTRDKKAHFLGRLHGRQLFLLLCMLGLISILPFSYSDAFDNWQHYFQVYFRLLLMGVLLLTAAVSLLQQTEKTLGQRLAATTITLWGGLYVGFALLQLLQLAPEPDIRVVLMYKGAELFLLCSLGLALLIWLHEHERSANKQLTEKTQYLNRYDQLTGALNRDAFLLQLTDLLQKQPEKPLQLLMLGLDKFKTINESVGLKQGDILLRQLTQRFQGSILKPLLIGRTGGDIFALVLADIDTDTQLRLALQHLQQLVQKNFHLAGEQVQLSCTIGMATAPLDGVNAEGLLQKANIAFHQAKRMQLAHLSYCAGMEEETARLISWESELLHAMQHNEFVLYFQPQVNLHSNKLEAFEVLVRWQHPEKGFLMPGQFLPFVEQLGLSRQLDFWILQRAIQTIRDWREQGVKVPLAVNMSSLHFQQDGLKQKIQQLLLMYQVSPELLELEITENTAMHDMEKGSNHVLELQQLGIRVSIDDFGTGYSSLAYLRSMPIDKIKIDRSFVKDMAANDSDMMIVKTMIKLAHGLGKRILAEGVETQVQLDLLRTMSCDAVQGYFFSKPLSEPDAISFSGQALS